MAPPASRRSVSRMLPLLLVSALCLALIHSEASSLLVAPADAASLSHSTGAGISAPRYRSASASPPPPPPPPQPIAAAASCAPSLNTKLVAAAVRSNALGLVIATFVNAAQADFALNWLAHLESLGLRDTALLGATDEGAMRALGAARAPCFRLRSEIGAAEAKWGSPGFSQMGRTKAALVRTLLSPPHNATLLFADADVVFLRDPLPLVAHHLANGAELLFHRDGFGSSPAALDEEDVASLERAAFGWAPELNTGLFVATPKAAGLAAAWCDALRSDGAFANWKNDQQSLNELVRRGVRVGAWSREGAGEAPSSATASSSRERLISAYGNTLKLGLLPAHLFPSGHVFFIQRQPRALNVTPYAVHLTFQNCDQAGKRHRIREARLWAIDPPEYYDPPGGLLSYSPDLPAHLTANFSGLARRNLRVDDEVLHRHFALINHQLVQVRTAFALAHVLNRTLVLPRFLCGLETVTNFAHSGIRCKGSAGCTMALPYWCPADHVLRMHYLAGVMPQIPQLPLRYREHSLPEHAASPYHRPAAIAAVAVPAAPARRCDACGPSGYLGRPEPPPPPAARTLELPAAALDADELARRLRPLASAPVLHFESLRPDGLRVELRGPSAARFDETLKPMGGGWCCVERKGFGHFWYDALWDTPHVDRFGRRWTEQRPWRPEPGP